MANDMFQGRFKLEKQECHEDFLKEIGCNTMKTKLAMSSNPKIEIKVDNGLYTIKTTHFKNSEISFRLGEEFEQSNLNGDTVNTTFVLHANVLTETQTPKSGDKIVQAIWEGLGDRLNVTRQCNNVTSVQKFVRE